MQHNGFQLHCTMMVKAFVLIAVAVVCLYHAFGFWCEYETPQVPRRVPRPLHALQTGTPASAADINWQQQALTNITRFRTKIVDLVRPYYSKKEFWNVFLPIISCPPSRPLRRYGGTIDGSKLLCDVATQKLQQEGCVIYSLGSNGDYAFEHSMLNATRCQVHTFDCTYANGTSQDPQRHHYHHWCFGGLEHGGQYRTWDNVTASLGHTRVDLLKTDIEGYEHEVLPSWGPGAIVPDELSMEFHVAAGGSWPGTTAELGLTFLFLADLGYAAYSQEVNAGAPHCCSEFTFMRLDATSGVDTVR